MPEHSPTKNKNSALPEFDLQDIFENAPIGIFTSTPEGRFISVNPAFARMYGYASPDDLLESIQDIAAQIYVDPRDRKEFIRELQEHGEIANNECRFRRRDGTEFWGTRNARAVKDEQGRIIAWQGFTMDITGQKLAERQERKSKERFRQMFMNAPMPYQSLDEQGNFVEVNQAFLDVLGYSREELTGTNFADILHPDDRKHFKENFPRFKAVGEILGIEFEMVKKDGSTILVYFTGKIQHDDQGRFQRTHCIFQDITDKRLTEEALRESEERFKALHNASFGGITIHDKGVILECNHGLSEITGYEYEELIGMNGLLLIAEKSREAVMSNILSGHEKPYEACGLRKNGEEYPLRLEARNIPYKGKMVRVVEFRDITEQKQSEDLLRKSEERFRSLFENSPIAYQSLDELGRYIDVNERLCELLGYTRFELLGMDFGELWSERTRHLFPETFNDFKRQSCVFGELELVRKDGSILVVILEGRVQRDAAGKFLRTHCILHDISERKRAEIELQQAKEQAEAANQAKSSFLANMSHEIRTPLNGIMGMLQLLEDSPLDAEQKQYTELCTSSAKRLTRLLSDILDLSRVEADKLTIHEEEFEVQEFCDSISGLFTHNAKVKEVEMECCIDPALPPRLIGDEARVRQILFNLVGNSMKFTDKGHIRIEMILLGSDKNDNANVLFTVTDTGIGIPEDQVKNLFDPFFQVEESYTRSFQGAGLGLPIVKRLVDLMNGKITVSSIHGQGTTMRVLLPFKLPAGVSILKQEEMTGQPPETNPELRILLAEDDPSNALPIRKLLEKSGHAVTLAEDGQQVLDLLKTQDFDVILMVIQMPVMNGVEATMAIRSCTELGPKKDIPIIALTAYAMLGDRENFLKAGMNDYLAKPVRREDLEQVLKNTTRS